MDFNTGSGGPQRPGNDPPPPQSSSGFSSPRSSMGSGTGDYNLSDPVGSFVATAREIIVNPVGFFRSVPRQGGFVPPLVFAVICAVISGLLGGILGLLINLIAGNGVGTAVGSLFGTLIITPIVTAIGLFIGAGIYHLLVYLLARPGSAGFEATFRVVAYASVIQLVTWLAAIPILGQLVALAAGVYNVVLSVLGIREVHGTTTGRAALIVLIPVAVLIILAVLLGVVLVAIFAAAFSQSQ
jgi:hypothetical protein